MLIRIFLMSGLLLATEAYTCLKRYCSPSGYCQETTQYCNATSYGCEVHRLFGDNQTTTQQGCSSQKCYNSYTPQQEDGKGDVVAIDCCDWENCNTPNFTATTNIPDVKQCYHAICFYSGCFEHIVRTGQARMCNASNGCIFVKNDNTQFGLCEEEDVDVTLRSEATLLTNGSSYRAYYCDTDLCNNGTVMNPIPDGPSCYNSFCQGVGCMKTALERDIVGYCQQVSGAAGCMTSIFKGDEIFGYGESRRCLQPGQPCTSIHNESLTVICCQGNLCNNGTERYDMTGGASIIYRAPVYVTSYMITIFAFMLIARV